jgi:transketolase
MKNISTENICINTIRFLSIDMVQKANSGHPGAPMSLAPAAFTLWKDHLNFNPNDPEWINRDRFILSAGHASALLYSMLHLTGYKLSIEDLKQFRQYGSITPGHPEVGLTPGVEATTGPLGQGFANGVGMAIASKKMSQSMANKDALTHKIYSIVSDGDLMEGISSEAASLAGTLGLGNLIYLYDSNDISIEGSTNLAFTENVAERFKSYGWDVSEDINGEDTQKISKAIENAKIETKKPSLIILKTKIGFGSPNKVGKETAHGEALGVKEVKLTRDELGWNYDPFEIPEEVLSYFKSLTKKKINIYMDWVERNSTRDDNKPNLINILPSINIKLMELYEKSLIKEYSSRDASGIILNKIAENTQLLIGGSADLAGSTKTFIKNSPSISSSNFSGINIHFGVREHSMGAIINGIALYSNYLPYAGTFLVFSDYMRSSIRLSALSKLQVFYIFTHDSIGLGEDGPTHQPVSQLMSLRLIPNLLVFRPADYSETVACYQEALMRPSSPSAFILSRQSLPVINKGAVDVSKGAYIVNMEDFSDDPDIILIGTGSELNLCLSASEMLKKDGTKCRVISIPCWELFESQDSDFKESIIPTKIKNRISVEAGATLGWQKFIGDNGVSIGLDDFGASAPGKTVLEKKGFSVENIYNKSIEILKR